MFTLRITNRQQQQKIWFSMNSLPLLKCSAKNHLIKHSSIFETKMKKNDFQNLFTKTLHCKARKAHQSFCRHKSWQLLPFALLNTFMFFNLFKIYFASLGRDFAKNQVDGNICKAFSHWMYVMMVEQSLRKVRKIVQQNVWRQYYKNVFLSC